LRWLEKRKGGHPPAGGPTVPAQPRPGDRLGDLRQAAVITCTTRWQRESGRARGRVGVGYRRPGEARGVSPTPRRDGPKTRWGKSWWRWSTRGWDLLRLPGRGAVRDRQQPPGLAGRQSPRHGGEGDRATHGAHPGPLRL